MRFVSKGRKVLDRLEIPQCSDPTDFDDLSNKLTYACKILGLSELSDDSESPEEVSCHACVRFNLGNEAESRQSVLEGLAGDIIHMAYHCVVDSSIVKPTDETAAISILNRLSEVMDQCCELEAASNHLPASSMKDQLRDKVAHVTTILTSLEQIVEENQREKKDVTAFLMTNLRAPDESGCEPKTIRLVKRPAFLPDIQGGKNPWNKWLDNSAKALPGWVALQQKIPRIGDILNRRKTLLYDALETAFEQDGMVVRDLETEPLEIPAPGDDFKHMTWSGFCTIPVYTLGFLSGKRKKYDADGVITLEYLSRELRVWQGRGGINVPTANCPFFRFAMAYKY